MFGLVKPNFSKVKKIEINFITQVFESALFKKDKFLIKFF